MFSTKSLAAATAAFALFASSTAEYDPNGKGNTVVYWGSGSNQQRLSYYCYDDSIDIIPIAFIDSFPAQANGLVGEAYSSNACWAGPTYAGPGYPAGNITTANNVLLTECPYIQQDLYDCQQNTNTKFLISLGGETGNYQLDTAADGVYLANFLWGAYGPYQQSWVDAGGIRPFDGGFYGTNSSMKIDIDGFDFDIEKASPNNQAGYIACINQLHILFDAYKLANKCSKDYIITGAPQCPRPDANMSNTINLAKFDIVWPQFYNNGPAGCTARDWANGNTAGFNFDSWASDLLTGASKDAKLYIGLLGGASGSSSAPGDYLTPAEAKSLIAAFESQPAFGGVMLWDAVSSSDSTDLLTSYKYANGSAIPASAAYYDVIKNYLDVYATPYTPTPSVCSSTTSSTSSTKISTSTSSSISTTSSVTPTTTSSSSSVHTTSSTSTSSTPTSTSSSSSSSPTKSSTSSTTSSALPTTTSSSSSSVPTTSSTSTTPTTSSTSSSLATSSSSSSSSSALPTTSSSSSSSSTTSSAAATSTTPTVPTHVPSVGSCVRIGCYTEGYNVRALTPFVYTDYAVMSPEICASKTSEYLYFGVEYGGECYGGNEINNGSVIVPDSQCDMTCGGYPGEYCGSGDRLDLYYCGGSTSSSSAAPTTSSTLSSSSAAVSTSSSSSVAVSTSSSSSSSSAVPTTSSSSYSSSATASSSSISSGPGSYPSSSLNSSHPTSSSSSSVTASASLSVSSGPGSYPSSSLNSSYTTSSSSSSVTASTSLSVSSGPGSYPSSSLNGSYPTSSSSLTATTSLSVSSGPGSYPTSSLNSTYSTSSSSRTRKSACSSHTKSSTGNSTYPTSTLSSTGTGSGGATSSSGSSSYPTTSSSTGTGSVVGTSKSGSSSSLITSTPSSTGTGSGGAVTTSSSISYTTSTVSTTTVYTITSCAATVTDCPARIGKVTTDTIVLYTTYCPVTATETGGGIPTSTPATSSPGVEYTTSTVYATTTYTITSCAPTVTNCPAKLGQVTTDTISLYVTVCPVSEAGSKAVSTANAAATSPSNTYSTTTVSSTTTQYVTVKVVPSTATLVPYPVSPTSQAKALGTGAGTSLPAVSLITTTAGAATTASPSAVQFKGAASTSRGPIGVILAVVLGAVIFMM